MLTLNQLLTEQTEDEVLTSMLAVLTQLGFQATAWQPTSWQIIILRVMAFIWSGFTKTLTEIVSGGFTTLATSKWLTLLARYVYDLERLEAQPAIGQFLLTSSAGAPVHTWASGDLIVADAPNGTAGANTYTCTAGGTLGPNATLSLEFKADVAGTAANIPPSTTLYLWTPLVGVTVTNPALLPASSTWITTPGQDEESDPRLAARCIGRWSRLTYGSTEGAYKGWCLEALPALTRVEVLAAEGDGTVTIVGATSLGGLSGGQITTITNYLKGITDGVGRRPINDILDVQSAVVVTSPALTITAYVLPDVEDTIDATIQTALAAYFGTVPIGGTRLVAGPGNVLFSRIMETCQKQNGVKSIVPSISADIPLGDNEIYSPTVTVNVIVVAPGVV
jgi:uncharacterized phage protein gp47/JayE